jgi:cell division protein FtsL
MNAELWSVAILFIVAALFIACFVYSGVTNYEIRKLKKHIKELDLKVSELQKKVGISN